jgi:hypothetical protein
LDDWRSVPKPSFIQHGGDKILRIYRDSFQAALKHIYPEHQWKTKRPPGYLNIKENQRKLLEDLASKLSKF